MLQTKALLYIQADFQRRKDIAERIWEVLLSEFLEESRQWMGLVKLDRIVQRMESEYTREEVEEGLTLLRYIPGRISLRATGTGTARSMKLGLYRCGASLPMYGFLQFVWHEPGGVFYYPNEEYGSKDIQH